MPSSADPASESSSAEAEFERRAASGRNRLIAVWAAEKMGLNPQSMELYAQAVEQFHADRPTEEDVIRKIYGDLLASNLNVRESEVRTKAAEFLAQAREALKTAEG
jgi:hypothetical protein